MPLIQAPSYKIPIVISHDPGHPSRSLSIFPNLCYTTSPLDASSPTKPIPQQSRFSGTPRANSTSAAFFNLEEHLHWLDGITSIGNSTGKVGQGGQSFFFLFFPWKTRFPFVGRFARIIIQFKAPVLHHASCGGPRDGMSCDLLPVRMRDVLS